MTGALCIPAVGGEAIRYGHVLAGFDGAEHPYFPVIRPPDTPTLLRALVHALILGRSLTLFDSEFSDVECAKLGGDPALFARAEPCVFPRIQRMSDFLEAMRHPNDFRLTLFTSGSTGLPKRVTHTRETLTRSVRTGPRYANDVWALAFNPTHMAGVQVILQALFNGNPLVDVFRAPRPVILEALTVHGITHLSATPSFFRLLLPLETPVASVRAITLGGEPSDGSLHARLRSVFPQARLRNLYASTEAGTVLRAEGDAFSLPAELRDRVRIDGGRLHLHRSLLAGFEGGSGKEDSGDWYDTGDRVEFLDAEERRFRIVARERSWINVGGDKVDPTEVESVLCEHPSVRAARVFAKANSVLGNLLAAEVVPTSETFDEIALRRDLAAKLQPYKIPRFFQVVGQLSLGRTGKQT